MSTKTLVSQPGYVPSVRAASIYSPSSSLCLLLSDFVVVSAVFWVAFWSKYLSNPQLDIKVYLEVFPSVLIFLAAFYSQGLYPALLLHPAEEMRRVFHSVTAVILVLVAITFFLKQGIEFSRFIILFSWVVITPAILFSRFVTRKLFGTKPWWPVPALVLGSGPAAEQVARGLMVTERGLGIAGMLLDQPIAKWDTDLPPVIGHMSDAPLVSRQRSIRYAVLAMPNRSQADIQRIIQDYCKSFNRILIVTDLLGICCLGISPREVGGQVGLEIPQRLSFVVPKVMKRCLDLVLCTVLILLLLPLCLIICVAIKLSSRGPVLYGHARHGRDGKSFRALKFRTMVPNADTILETHLASSPEQMVEWRVYHKLKRDPRITRVGRWLRRYSLDELPQLLNILAGDMSLVGPRPIVASEIERYAGSYRLYTRVPPGLTGLWQVSGRNNTTYEQRVAFDDYYIRNWSIWMDLYILARTFLAVLHAEGAY